jgi:hypothetical protein
MGIDGQRIDFVDRWRASETLAIQVMDTVAGVSEYDSARVALFVTV